MACNWPLRGMKRTLFEGGVRGVGLVAGAGLRKTGWRATGFIHAADWFHSLLRLAVQGIRSSEEGVKHADDFAQQVNYAMFLIQHTLILVYLLRCDRYLERMNHHLCWAMV